VELQGPRKEAYELIKKTKQLLRKDGWEQGWGAVDGPACILGTVEKAAGANPGSDKIGELFNKNLCLRKAFAHAFKTAYVSEKAGYSVFGTESEKELRRKALKEVISTPNPDVLQASVIEYNDAVGRKKSDILRKLNEVQHYLKPPRRSNSKKGVSRGKQVRSN
jgi:hypothetical protein